MTGYVRATARQCRCGQHGRVSGARCSRQWPYCSCEPMRDRPGIDVEATKSCQGHAGLQVVAVKGRRQVIQTPAAMTHVAKCLHPATGDPAASTNTNTSPAHCAPLH